MDETLPATENTDSDPRSSHENGGASKSEPADGTGSDPTATSTVAPAAAAAATATATLPKGYIALPALCKTRQTELVRQVRPGSRIEIYWPLDNTYYPACVVGESIAAEKKEDEEKDGGEEDGGKDTNKRRTGVFTLVYDDYTVETLDLFRERFNVLVGGWGSFAPTTTERAEPVSASSSSSAVMMPTTPPVHSSSRSTETTIVGSKYDSANPPTLTASVDALSDDVLFTVLSFVPTLAGLSAFGRTCRRMRDAWDCPYRAERLLGRMYRSRFGAADVGMVAAGADALVERSSSSSSSSSGGGATAIAGGGAGGGRYWRDQWENIYRLRSGLAAAGSPDYAQEGFNEKNSAQMCQLIRMFATTAPTPAGGGDAACSNGNDQPRGALSEATKAGGRRRRSGSGACTGRALRKSVGILTSREEDEAILYDNPSYAPSEDVRYCFGYFGMLAFSAVGPESRGASRRRTPTVVWGDFSGVRIYDSLEDMIYKPAVPAAAIAYGGSPTKGMGGGSSAPPAPAPPLPPPLFTSVAAHDEGLVLAVLACPPRECPDDCITNLHRPCLILGFASGMVMSISAFPTTDGPTEYRKGSAAKPHTNEVTALSLIPNPNTCAGGCDESMLASGSVDGKVYVYPYALSRERNYSLANPILAFTNGNSIPVFSVAGTVMQLADKTENAVVIGTGDQLGNISLWLRRKENTFDAEIAAASSRGLQAGLSKSAAADPNEKFHFARVRISPASSQRSRSGSIVTKMKFVHNNILITGSNFGDVRFWGLHLAETESYEHDWIGGTPKLTLRHRMSAAHGGTVEFVEVVGNIVLTSGGGDGLIKGWNLDNGTLLGVITCHAGRAPPEGLAAETTSRSLKSSVVGSVIYDKSLVSVCRDGTLHQWDYGDAEPPAESDRPSDTDWLSAFLQDSDSTSSTTAKGKQPRSASKGRAKVHAIGLLKILMGKTGHSSLINRKRMQVSIMTASIKQALRPGHRDGPFLGADGKTYESVKRAFALYSGLQACPLCQSQAQGAFFCRLVRKHELPSKSLAAMRSLRSTAKRNTSPVTESQMSFPVIAETAKKQRNRGRPLGSKNKPKQAKTEQGEASTAKHNTSPATESQMSSPKQRKRGRPLGSKNKPKQAKTEQGEASAANKALSTKDKGKKPNKGPSKDASAKIEAAVEAGDEWSCEQCTFRNQSPGKSKWSPKCLICKAPKPKLASVAHETTSVSEAEPDWSCHRCTFTNPETAKKCRMCKVGRSKKQKREHTDLDMN